MRTVASTWTIAAVALCGLAIVACATQSAPAPATESTTAAATSEAPAPAAAAAPGRVVGPPEVAWQDMTKEQKGKFMKAVVTPRMRELFQAFDAEEFQKFDCYTCHGADAKQRGFKMPAPELFVLPATPAEFGVLMEKKPRWMKFMAETVKPQMAALIGVKEFNPKEPQAGGFGCMGCHTSKAN